MCVRFVKQIFFFLKKEVCFTVTFTGYRYGTAAIFRAINITDILQNDRSWLPYEIK